MQITESDRTAIHSVIESQLKAFQKDDAALAFSFATPGIQKQFITPENFMQMVKTAYKAVYRPRSVIFEDFMSIQGIPAQPVLVLDPDGVPVMAIYVMEKQRDNSWRINGCYMAPVERNFTQTNSL